MVLAWLVVVLWVVAPLAALAAAIAVRRNRRPAAPRTPVQRTVSGPPAMLPQVPAWHWWLLDDGRREI